MFEARHLLIGSRSAVKILHAAVVRNRGIFKRFQKEAQIAGALGQVNVVKVTDMGGLESDRPYIVMEYLEGQTLRDHLDSAGPLPISEALELTIQLLRGLATVHKAGVIHRDLKPDNVFLTKVEDAPRPVAKILDFGVSKVLGPKLDQGTLTKTGAIVGTPYYMSPEQAMGKKEMDHRTDIYSVGAILYQMLTGSRPFQADNYNALIAAILMQDPEPPRTLRPEVPEVLEAAVLKALSREAEDRFETVPELLRELESIASDTGIELEAPENASRPRTSTSSSPSPSSRAGISEDRSSRPASRTRNVLFPSLFLVGGIAGVAVVVGLAGRGRSPSEESAPPPVGVIDTGDADRDESFTRGDADLESTVGNRADAIEFARDGDLDLPDDADAPPVQTPPVPGKNRPSRNDRPSIRRDVPF